jgi:translation elongation factor P/translation initiation factor 5A
MVKGDLKLKELKSMSKESTEFDGWATFDNPYVDIKTYCFLIELDGEIISVAIAQQTYNYVSDKEDYSEIWLSKDDALRVLKWLDERLKAVKVVE